MNGYGPAIRVVQELRQIFFVVAQAVPVGKLRGLVAVEG
jgi:hypothetical protein